MPAPNQDIPHIAAFDELLQSLLRNRVRVAEIGERHRTDWSGMDAQRPRAPSRPSPTRRSGSQPVVPQGWLMGGAQARTHEIEAPLKRVNRIEEVNSAGGCLTALAGTTLESIQGAADAVGLT